MNNENEFNGFKEELNKIRENEIIEVNSWWGFKNPGYEGTIVTQNREIYKYQYYHIVPDELKDKSYNYIQKIKKLTVDEYEKVVLFIEEEIENKEFTNKIIYDAGYDVIINYNGTNKRIMNNKGFEDNIELYDKAEILLKELLK